MHFQIFSHVFLFRGDTKVITPSFDFLKKLYLVLQYMLHYKTIVTSFKNGAISLYMLAF